MNDNENPAGCSRDGSISVLLVEDNPGDRDLLVAHLEEPRGAYNVAFAAALSELRDRIDRQAVDVILLDLGLPDSQGTETFRRAHRMAPETPIVVITGLDDESIGVETLKSGAQDYLVKGRVEPEVLKRSLSYAVERHRLQRQLERERAERDREREELVQRGLSAPASIAARLYGRKLLHESAPRESMELSTEYGTLLQVSLENQLKKTQHDISTDLRKLADRLGMLAAGPRDVVEVHKAALRKVDQNEPPAKVKAMTVEGRFLVLELMGHLVSFYRRNCTNLTVSTGANGYAKSSANGDGQGEKP